MAQREGSVFLWLFVASFVVLIGVVVFFFMENAEKKKVEGDLATALKQAKDNDARANQYNQDLTNLRKLVGGETVAASWPGDETYRSKLNDAQQFLNETFRRLENRTPKTFNEMGQAYDDYKDLVTKLLETRQQAQDRHKVSQAEKVDLTKANKEEVQRKDELIAQLKDQASQTEAKLTKQVSDGTAETERLQKELATSKDELATAEIKYNRMEQYYKNLVASLQTRLAQLQDELRKTKTIEDIEPDGRILQVVGTSQIGWIDIGRKNHLRNGLEFRVFQNVKGGKRQYKGTVEVRRVDETTSEFRILQTDDELNPITQGDYITSPFYDPKAVPVFVIAGEGLESRELTEEGLREKIKSYGAEISNEVDLKTTFLIALKGYEKSPLYSTARELAVAILREREILEYLGRN